MTATATIPEPLIGRVRRLVKSVRLVVDPIIDLPPPHMLATLTDLLASVPVSLCQELCTTWEALQICLSAEELERQLSAEDRLVIEMVEAIYNHQRTCTVKHDTLRDPLTHVQSGIV